MYTSLLTRAIEIEWVIGILLLAALWKTKENRLANRILALVIICGLYRQYLIYREVVPGLFPPRYVLRTSFPVGLLAVCSLSFYVRSLTNSDFRISFKDPWFFLPPLFGIFWYVGILLFGEVTLFQPGPELDRERYARLLIRDALMIPYLWRMHIDIRDFTKIAKEYFSYELRLKWLVLIVGIVYVFFSLDLADVLTGPSTAVWQFSPLLHSIALFVLAVFSLRYSRIFAELSPAVRTELHKADAKGHLSSEQLERLKERLLSTLKGEKLYLNPELRLSDLANALGVRPYLVSEVLGRGLETNFYELVNRMRVEHAQAIAASPEYAHMNLLGISLESGFKSKSVFNDTFKSVTGKTPSEFRREASKES